MLLLDLKSACDACEFELQSLKHRYEGLSPTQQSAIALPDLVPHTPKRVSYYLFYFIYILALVNPILSLSLSLSLSLCLSLSLSQPLASGLQIIDVVSSVGGAGVSPCT